MAFTNTYDVNFPPDTQAANQLGQDLRSLALNVQERMSLISGLIANRPDFSTDAQPSNWAGLLFFSTDEAKVYRWNGASWDDITTTFFPPPAPPSATNPHVLISLFAINKSSAVPLTVFYTANALDNAFMYRLSYYARIDTAGNAVNLALSITWSFGVGRSVTTANIPCNVLGADSTSIGQPGCVTFRVAPGDNIYYSTTLSGNIGTGLYSVALILEGIPA